MDFSLLEELSESRSKPIDIPLFKFQVYDGKNNFLGLDSRVIVLASFCRIFLESHQRNLIKKALKFN